MKRVVTYDETLKPEKKTRWAICYDLKAAEDVVIQPWEIKIVKLWIKTNFAWKLYSRSSLPIKKWLIIANWVGIIDEDFRHEAWIILYNTKSEPVEIKFWERIAQMEVLWDDDSIEIFVDKNLYEKWEEIEKTERKWGFWSTWGYKI